MWRNLYILECTGCFRSDGRGSGFMWENKSKKKRTKFFNWRKKSSSKCFWSMWRNICLHRVNITYAQSFKLVYKFKLDYFEIVIAENSRNIIYKNSSIFNFDT